MLYNLLYNCGIGTNYHRIWYFLLQQFQNNNIESIKGVTKYRQFAYSIRISLVFDIH